ncbi:MAG TPA: PilZ domain-containing protein [Candidatus Sulfotelmatobacter sp.]
MDSPQRSERRDVRYPLHLPVLVRMAQRKEMRARSENISLSGILLSSSFLIPEGSAVEVSIGVEHLPDPGILLKARGKVLRVEPMDSGHFAVAIQLLEAFKLPLSEAELHSSSKEEKPPSSQARRAAATSSSGMNFVPAWHTET